MNIGGIWGGIGQNPMFAGNCLKSTQEKRERRQECDKQVAFYENRIAALKDMGGDSLDTISRKLELFHMYQDGITAAKHAYNSQQMFHAMDEARERGEKLAEAAEERKPKTAEERKKEAIREALGIEGSGLLSELLDNLEGVEETGRLLDEPEVAKETDARLDEPEVVKETDARLDEPEVAKEAEDMREMEELAEQPETEAGEGRAYGRTDSKAQDHMALYGL